MSLLSARLKRSCYIVVTKKTVKTRRQPLEERTNVLHGRSTIDVSYKNNAHIPGNFLHYFPKDVAVWPKWTRFDRRHREDFTLQCLRPLAPYRLRRHLL